MAGEEAITEVGKVPPVVEIQAISPDTRSRKNPKDEQQPQTDTPAATFEHEEEPPSCPGYDEKGGGLHNLTVQDHLNVIKY